MNAKNVNYSAETTATLLAGFASGKTVEVLATEIGKSVRSVVAKLSREGVYTAKAKVKAEGKTTKTELVAAIEVKFGVETGTFASLEKATKEALAVLAG